MNDNKASMFEYGSFCRVYCKFPGSTLTNFSFPSILTLMEYTPQDAPKLWLEKVIALFDPALVQKLHRDQRLILLFEFYGVSPEISPESLGFTPEICDFLTQLPERMGIVQPT